MLNEGAVKTVASELISWELLTQVNSWIYIYYDIFIKWTDYNIIESNVWILAVNGYISEIFTIYSQPIVKVWNVVGNPKQFYFEILVTFTSGPALSYHSSYP